MIRLITLCLVAATVRIQVTGNYQAGPSGGESSPLYNLVASSFLSKCPGLNTTSGNPGPLTCTCGFCNQRNSLPGPPQSTSVLSGVVVFPSSELQQILRAPVPVPLYAPSPHSPPSPQPPPSYIQTNQQPNPPSSYIMSIPRKNSQEISPPKRIQEIYTPFQNNIYSSNQHPTPPTSPPPRPFYYTPKSPLMASCPATFYFPATQPTSFNQPSVYSFPASPQVNPSLPSFPSGPNINHPTAKPTLPNPQVAVPPFPPVPPNAATKEPMVTYTLRTSSQPDVSPGTSLEAESKDCSMPTPPVLI